MLTSRPHLVLALAALLLGASRLYAAPPPSDAPGTTQILPWKDGLQACFILAFDDSAPSQLKYAIPELEKRQLVGTFYLVTGNKLYAGLRPQWEAAAKSPSVVVANHTFTHTGAKTVEDLGPELAKCNQVLYALHPERRPPYLLAFGKPGGVPWDVTPAQVAAELQKNHLIERPPFAGPPIHYKSLEQVLAVVDRALEKGEMGHLDFHGIGTDWLVTPLDWFLPLLDKLQAARDRLWVTDTLSWHQYVTQRQQSEIKVLEATPDRLRLSFTSALDPQLYDAPLTLTTRLPAAWKSCRITQGTVTTTVPIRAGLAQYYATPGTGDITLQPAD